MKRLLKFVVFIATFIYSIAFTSCKTTNILPERQKDFSSENTVYAEMSTVRIKVGSRKIRQNVTFKLYGTLEGNIFSVNEIYWFDNWQNGWTEAKFAASGQLKLRKTNQKYYEVVTPIVMEFPTQAKLRIKDSVLIEDKALKTFENRMDRISSAIELLKDENAAFNLKNEFIPYPEFENIIGSVLFPEKYGFRNEFNYYSKFKHLSHKEMFSLGDGVYWNIDYTKDVYPEYMWDVRNSGTLYKDWEENIDLFFYLYNWDFIFGNGAVNGSFKKISWK